MAATPRSTRRAFLKGQAAVDAIAQFDLGGPEDAALPEPARRSHLLQLSRRAMACTFEVFIRAAQQNHGTESALAALDLVDRLEDQLSVYRDDSEVSRLNRTAADGPVEVEERLFALLVRALELYRETGGAFDVTAGRLSAVWGFRQRQGQVPTAEQLEAARAAIGSQHVTLDPAARTVCFNRPGLEINLGSIGKGYALDRAAEWLEAVGIGDFLLHGGSSSVLARGVPEADSAGWSIGVRNPLEPTVRVGCLRLSDRALATSGSGTQFFLHEGRRYGHILDPRSGWPAADVLSATVLAASAADADALATAFYVMGPQAAEEYCRKHAGVASVMICPGRQEGTIETHLFGLGEDEWTAPDRA